MGLAGGCNFCGTDAVGMDRNNSEMLTWSEMLLGERSGRRQDHSFKCRHILNQEKKNNETKPPNSYALRQFWHNIKAYQKKKKVSRAVIKVTVTYCPQIR